MGLRKLSELDPGSIAVVRQFASDETRLLRLREMGLLPGTRLTFIRTAPLGDPIEIRLRGYLLSLRRADASHVLVEPS